jgi:hypothetical protein
MYTVIHLLLYVYLYNRFKNDGNNVVLCKGAIVILAMLYLMDLIDNLLSQF